MRLPTDSNSSSSALEECREWKSRRLPMTLGDRGIHGRKMSLGTRSAYVLILPSGPAQRRSVACGT